KHRRRWPWDHAFPLAPVRPVNALKLLAPVLALAVLAAHFYRAGLWLAVGGVAALAALLFVRSPWAARTLQVALVAGAVEWIRSAAELVALRESMGQPWTRLALILGGVALATAACALLFQWRPVRERFGIGRTGHPGS
ncbi:MAG TPA: hypothetical protein PLO41_16840, partial [Rubrivivax sp.]|nr:hypothetical protein [Rubrivivax sp.]